MKENIKIDHVRVYDLKESIIACRYAMMTEQPEMSDKEFIAACKRATKLAKAGSPHANFRTGIRVSFNLHYPNYLSPDMQRYHWIDIVTSSSKMNRLVKMDFDKCCNRHVTRESISQMKKLIGIYNEEPTEDNFLKVLSNCPMGVVLFMRISTNYEQLATIYRQRKHHKIPEWRDFCKWIETLPMARELIICEDGQEGEGED